VNVNHWATRVCRRNFTLAERNKDNDHPNAEPCNPVREVVHADADGASLKTTAKNRRNASSEDGTLPAKMLAGVTGDQGAHEAADCKKGIYCTDGPGVGFRIQIEELQESQLGNGGKYDGRCITKGNGANGHEGNDSPDDDYEQTLHLIQDSEKLTHKLYKFRCSLATAGCCSPAILSVNLDRYCPGSHWRVCCSCDIYTDWCTVCCHCQYRIPLRQHFCLQL
jgi:hypothetical protein